ncbi:MAG TPA: hypothetical protein VJN65_08725, partial [Bacteroidota bacterium]|nr:hypothetical protein [Bacteroidota bacterium]
MRSDFRSRPIALISLSMVLVLFLSVVALAKEPSNSGKKGGHLAKTMGTPSHAVLNINNITAWMRVD